MVALLAERDRLGAEREALPPHERADATARVAAVAVEIAAIAGANRNTVHAPGARWVG